MSMTKVERAEMEALRRQVRELETSVEVLRGTVTIKGAVGKVMLNGYGDEPLPIGEYFRVSITEGQSAGLEACLSSGLLSIYASEGNVLALPSSSNVMRFARGYELNSGLLLASERHK